MISYTTLALFALCVALWRLGWFVTLCIALAAVSLPMMGQLGEATRSLGTMVDHAVTDAVGHAAVGMILPALGWG